MKNKVFDDLDEMEETTDIETEKARNDIIDSKLKDFSRQKVKGLSGEQPFEDISEWDTDIDLKPKPKIKYKQRMKRLNLLSPR